MPSLQQEFRSLCFSALQPTTLVEMFTGFMRRIPVFRQQTGDDMENNRGSSGRRDAHPLHGRQTVLWCWRSDNSNQGAGKQLSVMLTWRGK